MCVCVCVCVCVCEIGSTAPKSCSFVVCCLQDLFKTECSFFSFVFISVQVVHPYNSTDTFTLEEIQFYFISEIMYSYDR